MLDEREECDEVVAAGAICPMPDCGALVIEYISDDGMERDHPEPREFTCPHCGINFAIPEDELIFQSVQRKWLLARIQAA